MAQRQKKADKVVDWSTLKGKFFHAFDDEGYVQHQGCIVELAGEEIAIVQYFEWALGDRSTIKAVWVKTIVDEGWALYESDEAMRDAYEYFSIPRR